MLDALAFFVSLASCVDIATIFNALGGAYSVEEITYSVDSLWSTGVVQEDSIFWNCATMGNRICG